jgi:hypothetical protein
MRREIVCNVVFVALQLRGYNNFAKVCDAYETRGEFMTREENSPIPKWCLEFRNEHGNA